MYETLVLFLRKRGHEWFFPVAFLLLSRLVAFLIGGRTAFQTTLCFGSVKHGVARRGSALSSCFSRLSVNGANLGSVGSKK